MITFVVGLILVVKSNFLTTAKMVIEDVRNDTSIHEDSELKQKKPEPEDALHQLDIAMKVIGAIILAVSIFLLMSVISLMTLMCGPNSCFVRNCVCLESLRDDMEDEIIDMKDTQDLLEYYSRFHSEKMSDKSKHRITRAIEKKRGTSQTDVGKEKLKRTIYEESLKDIAHTTSNSQPAYPEKHKKKHDKSLEHSAPQQFRRSTSSRASASPGKDRKRYDKSLKEIAPHAGRTTSSSPSASPDKDRKRYETSLREKVPDYQKKRSTSRHSSADRKHKSFVGGAKDCFQNTSSSPSASPDKDRKKYEKSLRENAALFSGGSRASSFSPHERKKKDHPYKSVSCSPSASPSEDKKKYKKSLKEAHVPRGLQNYALSASPGADRKMYDRNIKEMSDITDTSGTSSSSKSDQSLECRITCQ